MLFDSHTHINNEEYTPEDREELVRAIEASDVGYAVDAGFDVPSSIMAAEHAAKYDWCYAAVGVHPHDTDSMTYDDLEQIRNLAKKPGVVAIGEIGLDYYRDLSPRDMQAKWFREQIRLALELGMPIMIHQRDAYKDVMDILVEEGAFDKSRTDKFEPIVCSDGTIYPDARVLIHCFSGSWELAQEYIKAGATISICGPVTYKNNRRTVEVASKVPLELMTVETDAPYLTPVPFRGKPNMSPYVEHTVRKIAEIKELEYQEVAEVTCSNSKRFFDIK